MYFSLQLYLLDENLCDESSSLLEDLSSLGATQHNFLISPSIFNSNSSSLGTTPNASDSIYVSKKNFYS